MHIYDKITASQRKHFAVLIDPDKYSDQAAAKAAGMAAGSGVDFIFVGGSLLSRDNLGQCLRVLKENCNLPVILFPGSVMQVDGQADAILLLSLISGRNPDLLIGKHVIAAPYLRSSGLEVLSTGYMLIDGGNNTTAMYISNTQPIPSGKSDIAMCTAMAGEMLGMKLIYLDAGSGANNPVPVEMVEKVRQNINIPLIVGGGIRNAAQAAESCEAGADIIVVGNAIEQDPNLIREISDGIHSA
jgi:putative glycerol-1-phosphate prenyltransferase